MSDQSDKDWTNQELHAPEVVKPIISPRPPPHPPGDRLSPAATELATQRAITPDPPLPAGREAAASPSHREEKREPSTSTIESPVAISNGPPSVTAKPTPEPKPTGRGWVVAPIVIGVVALILWAVHYETTQRNRDAPPKPSESIASRSSQVPPPRDLGYQGENDHPSHLQIAAVAPVPPQQYVTPPSAPPTGRLRISAYARDTQGIRHPVAQEGHVTLIGRVSSLNISTNVVIPCLWRNIPPDDYHVSIAVPGYRESTNNKARVLASVTNQVAIALQPLPVRVRFTFPVANVLFSVHNDTMKIGTSATAYDLTPFVPHYLTFKADGWRTKRVKVQLAEPGKQQRCAIDMEKVASSLIVTLREKKGDPPLMGMMSVNGGTPIEVSFPLERNDLPISGPMTLTVFVDGYNVLNSTRQVILVDREMTEVTFEVERKSWISRTFGSSERPTERISTETEP